VEGGEEERLVGDERLALGEGDGEGGNDEGEKVEL
jgi:hypothetical protein